MEALSGCLRELESLQRRTEAQLAVFTEHCEPGVETASELGQLSSRLGALAADLGRLAAEAGLAAARLGQIES
ncbi:MAG: hypothetical protein AMXMBFR33_52100 [Candidatus Xenobia bacterium]